MQACHSIAWPDASRSAGGVANLRRLVVDTPRGHADRGRLLPSPARRGGSSSSRPRRATDRTPRSRRRCASRAARVKQTAERSRSQSLAKLLVGARHHTQPGRAGGNQAGRQAGANACAVRGAPRIEGPAPRPAGTVARSDRPMSGNGRRGPRRRPPVHSAANSVKPALVVRPSRRVIPTPRCDSRMKGFAS